MAKSNPLSEATEAAVSSTSHERGSRAWVEATLLDTIDLPVDGETVKMSDKNAAIRQLCKLKRYDSEDAIMLGKLTNEELQNLTRDVMVPIMKRLGIKTKEKYDERKNSEPSS